MGKYLYKILILLISYLPVQLTGQDIQAEISIEWESGKLLQVNVKSLLGNKLNLRYAGKQIQKETIPEEIYSFQIADFNY